MAEAGDLLLALDVGTGGTRAHAFSISGEHLGSAGVSYPTYHDRPGWAEQDAKRYWPAAQRALRVLLRSLPGWRPRALGLTGQCPTFVPVNASGRPTYRAMIYQDNRATAETQLFRERFGAVGLHAITGQPPAAFYVGPKILWLRRHEPDAFAATRWFLQPRDLVAMQLTGNAATDYTHANCTLFFDLEARRWSEEVIRAFGLDHHRFPEKHRPWSLAGVLRPALARRLGLPAELPVVIGAADSQCTAFAVGVVEPGQLSDMAGTSTCLNSVTSRPLLDENVPMYAHVVPDLWCTELGLNASGASASWAAPLLSGRRRATPLDLEALARQSPPGANGVIFLPHLADGERDNPDARGAFHGLSLRHQPADLARAVFEGVAFAIRRHCDVLAEAGQPVTELRVSGGAAGSGFWNQIKADILGVPVLAAAQVESTAALGAALLAGIGVGVFADHAAAAVGRAPMLEPYQPNDGLSERYDRLYATYSELAGVSRRRRGR